MPRSFSSWVRIAAVVGALAAAVYFLRGLDHIVRLVVIGGLLAYLLDPLTRALESRGLSRRVATSLICCCLALLLILVTYLVSPLVAAQVSGLQRGFDPTDVNRLLDRVDYFVNTALVRLGAAEIDVPVVAQRWLAAQSSNVIAVVPDLLSVLVDLLIIPFIMFFLLRDGPDMKRTFISWIPNRYFEFTLSVIHKSSRKLSSYLRGQATASLVVGILASIVLKVIGVDYFLLIGLFAGFANMIPYVGPFAGGALAVCVSALTTGSFDDALWIVLSFAAIQGIDNVVVQPLVLSRNVQMHPLAVILVLIVGGQLFGLLGLLLAVPVAAVTTVVVGEFAGNLRRFRLA